MSTERRYSEVVLLIKGTDKSTGQPATTLDPAHPQPDRPKEDTIGSVEISMCAIHSQTKVSDETTVVGMVGSVVDIKKQQLSFFCVH